jgi:hypothetical protein
MKNGFKVLLVALVFCLGFPVVSYSSSVLAATPAEHDKSDVVTQEVNAENNPGKVENMKQLPFDLIEDVEVMDYEKNKGEIVTEEEEFTSFIDLDKSQITYTDSEGNEISISSDDPDLEYAENRDGTIVFENKKRGYSVSNQILYKLN